MDDLPRQVTEAIYQSQAVASFGMDGTILDCNSIFLRVMGGYELSEVKGKHHRLFVTEEYAKSDEYAAFWERLRRGVFQTAEFKRVGCKGGKEVWLQATYTPIRDMHGHVIKVVKFATDITEQSIASLQLSVHSHYFWQTCLTKLERL